MKKSQYHHGDLKTTILDAAELLLQEKSLDAISMRELARKADVSPGAPYHHFGDRVGLVTALCQRGFLKLYRALSNASTQEGLQGMIREYLEFSKNNYAIYQLMFSAEATKGDIANALLPQTNPVFELLNDEIDKINPSTSAEENLSPISVWCFMHGLASLHTNSPLHIRSGKDDFNEFAYQTILKLTATSN